MPSVVVVAGWLAPQSSHRQGHRRRQLRVESRYRIQLPSLFYLIGSVFAVPHGIQKERIPMVRGRVAWKQRQSSLELCFRQSANPSQSSAGRPRRGRLLTICPPRVAQPGPVRHTPQASSFANPGRGPGSATAPTRHPGVAGSAGQYHARCVARRVCCGAVSLPPHPLGPRGRCRPPEPRLMMRDSRP